MMRDLATRQRQQFVSIDPVGRVKTFSRACIVNPGEFLLVRVPLKRGRPDLSGLSVADRRFVEQNITPGEYRRQGNGGTKH